MPTLYNRVIEFDISTIDNQGNNKFLHSFRRGTDGHSLPISVSFNKVRDWLQWNTGTISITNPTRSVAKELISPGRTGTNFYNLKVGYDEGRNTEIKTFSKGIVVGTSWRHSRGDVTLDMSLTETAKILENPYMSIPNQKVITLEKGITLYKAIEKIISLRSKSVTQDNIILKIDPAFTGIESDLRNITLKDHIPLTRSIQLELNDLLRPHGFDYFINNQNLFITKDIHNTNIDININNNFQVVNLNFKTGLLNASATSSLDINAGLRRHYLEFTSLFIPEIKPGSLINLDGYEHLKGAYLVYNLNYSLNNHEGDFNINGSNAINLNFRDKNLQGFRDLSHLTGEVLKHTLDSGTVIWDNIKDRISNEAKKYLSQFGYN